jgi:hypothetical protein
LAKKKTHEDEIRIGIEELRTVGLNPDDASPALVAPMRDHFGRGRTSDLAIIFALGKIADASAVEALTRFEREITDKELKKEIRRSLFKLGQRGLSIPEPELGESKPSHGILASGPEIEAYLSAVDGSGGRLLWIAKSHAGHGLQLVQAMISDREGLLRIAGTPIRRKELRNMSQEIKDKHGVSMISIPWEYADQILYEAYEKAKSQARSGLEHFQELRGLIATGKPKEQRHPIYERLNAHNVRDGAWRERSRRLLDEPELRFWILDEDFVHPFLSQVQEAQTSRLVLNQVQKEERLAGIVRDVVKALCAGEMGTRMRRRMEDMALYFAETGREELAKLALAMALQIKEGDPGPLDVSFLTGLVQKSFAFYLSEQKTKAEEEPSLIVKP